MREESLTPDLFMAPRTPNRVRNVQGVIIRTPQEDREERRRPRDTQRDTEDEDEENETEDEEPEGLPLHGVDNLSTEELRKLMGAMDILNKLTPDAFSALNSRPLQTVKKVDELSHSDQVRKIAELVGNYLEPLFDRETLDMYRRSKDLRAERPEFWARLFGGIRPERQEQLPSVTQYDHCPLIDLRPVKPVGDVETALKAKPRDQAQDDLLFKLLDKPMRPLHGLISPKD